MALECRRRRRHSARWLLKAGMTRSAHGPSQIAIWRLHPAPKIAEALRREPKDRTTSRPCTIRVRLSACRAYKASFAKVGGDLGRRFLRQLRAMLLYRLRCQIANPSYGTLV